MNNELFNNNINLVHQVIKTLGYTTKNSIYEDLYQEGCIGLVKACNSFDNDKKFCFSTFAFKVIKNQILMYLRKENKRARDVSLNQEIAVGKDGSKLTYEEILEDKSINIEDSILIKEINEQIDLLPDRDKNLINDFMEGMNQNQLAVKYNQGQGTISRRLKKIFNEIKNKLEC